MTTPGPTRLPAVTRQPAHLTALVATDERPGAHLATALVESVSVTGPAVPGARVLTFEDGLTLGMADLILGSLVAGNNLHVTTLQFLLHLINTFSSWGGGFRAVFSAN